MISENKTDTRPLPEDSHHDIHNTAIDQPHSKTFVLGYDESECSIDCLNWAFSSLLMPHDKLVLGTFDFWNPYY